VVAGVWTQDVRLFAIETRPQDRNKRPSARQQAEVVALESY